MGYVLALVLSLASFTSAQQLPNVKLTTDLASVDKAVPIQQIVWTAPWASTIYCVSDTATSLVFDCANCNMNNTNERAFMAALQQATTDMRGQVGYPAIKLSDSQTQQKKLFITSDIIQRTLRCNATGVGGQQQNFQQPQQQNFQQLQGQPQFGQQQQQGQPQFGQQQQQGQPQFGQQQQQGQPQFGQQQQQGQSQFGQQQQQGHPQFQQQDFQPQQQFGNVASALALINVQYLNRPQIVNDKGERPAFSPTEGYRFFIGTTDTLRLTCLASGNPPVSSSVWTVDGAQLANTADVTVTAQLSGKSLLCRTANDVVPGGLDSDQVRIQPWDKPVIQNANYQQIAAGGGTSGRYNMDQSVTISCIVAGNPRPKVIWKIANPGTTNMNASCAASQINATGFSNGMGMETLQQQPSQQSNSYQFPLTDAQRWVIQSDCSLRLDDYSKGGTYWCEACTELTANNLFCNPGYNDQQGVPSTNAVIKLNGKPVIKPSDVSVQVMGTNEAQVTVLVCAFPAPTQMSWDISGTTVQEGAKVGRYNFVQRRMNTTYQDCLDATLVISPLDTTDQSKTYTLKVTNTITTTQMVVDVRQKLFPSSSAPHIGQADSVGLGVGLGVGLFILLLIIIVGCLWWRKAACFSTRKRSPQERYQSNVAPGNQYSQHLRAEPEPLPRKTPPPSDTNGFNTSGSSENKPDTNGFRQSREGLTYAELDLVRDGARPPPRPEPPTQYAHLQPAYTNGSSHAKVSTNSIV